VNLRCLKLVRLETEYCIIFNVIKRKWSLFGSSMKILLKGFFKL